MRRRFTLDIEINYDEIEPFDLVIKKGSSPIQMFGCYDYYKNKFYSFFYHKKVKIIPLEEIKNKTDKKLYLLLKKHFGTQRFTVKEGNFISDESGRKWKCRYLDFNNEKVMIRAFMKLVKDLSPDIYSGFFVETFDLLYIINRCRTLKVSYNYLSPLQEVYLSHGRAKIRGSIIYDLPKTYAKYMGTHRHANSLKKIAESHLKRDDNHKITKTSGSIINEDWYDNDWDKFKKYCLTDVELCILLEEELELMNMAEGFEKFTGTNPEFIFFTSNLIESVLNFIKPIYEKQILKNKYKIAFNTKKRMKFESAAGALVLESQKGFYRKGLMIILDLKKEYPKIIESLNISPETLVKIIDQKEKDKYNYCKENDVYYVKEPIGFIPFAFKFFYMIRDRIEKERDKFEFGSDKYNDMNKKRQTVKDIINAVTGQADYDNSIILNPICADSCRLTGQKEILLSAEYTTKFGAKTIVKLKVIYGDTDSIFVWLKNIEDVEIAKKISEEICKWIQVGFDKYAKELNLETHQFEIGLEKILDVFVSIGKKKKYFGHILWADGNYIKEENSLLVKGFETRRTDSSDLTDKVQKEIFGLINKTRTLGWKEIKKKILYKIRKEYPNKFTEDNLLIIGIPKKINKQFKDYKVTSAHLRGCEYANKYLNTNFRAGSKPKLIYIKEVKGKVDETLKMKYPHTDVLCVEEGMKVPEGIFIIDKERMMEKTVFNKLEKTLDVVRIKMSEIEDGLKETNLFDFMDKFKNKETLGKNDFLIDKKRLNKVLTNSEKIIKIMKKEV
ncbi:hypothetical protein LCGC14_0795070 [marine sediment metagenome]|uniref:DNA-directed DNA polymerase n=1 Tax=marine sediment metagenome TaxID=412755 RepID=A0A0F9PRF2_9ZZZZ